MTTTPTKPGPAPPATRPPASAATAPARGSRAGELLRETFAGTPGRLRLFGGIAVAACLAFGVFSFVIVNQLNDALGNSRDHAAQLVRIQTIRTSLVKADANATNAFLTAGLEPAAVRQGYNDGINTAAATIAEASSAEPRDAAELQEVNRKLTAYAGLIEAARANNRQGFPVGAAYLRQASRSLQEEEGALPQLEALVNDERERVDASVNAADQAQTMLGVLLGVVLVALVIVQFWLFRRTRRILNPSLVVATVIVLVAGLLAVGVVEWSQSQAAEARDGPYAGTVALATARIGGFDAKSAESLTLIARGSGQAYEARFKTVSGEALSALRRGPVNARAVEINVRSALDRYVRAHQQVRAADDSGKYDEAVALATGNGAANTAFANFEQRSTEALEERADQLADDLNQARLPLTGLSWLLLLAGIAAAIAARRGVAERLREYR
jgi:hypothetical protein